MYFGGSSRRASKVTMNFLSQTKMKSWSKTWCLCRKMRGRTLTEWSWQAGGTSLGLLSAESVEGPITDTTKLLKCHFPSRGHPNLLPSIMLGAALRKDLYFYTTPLPQGDEITIMPRVHA